MPKEANLAAKECCNGKAAVDEAEGSVAAMGSHLRTANEEEEGGLQSSVSGACSALEGGSKDNIAGAGESGMSNRDEGDWARLSKPVATATVLAHRTEAVNTTDNRKGEQACSGVQNSANLISKHIAANSSGQHNWRGGPDGCRRGTSDWN